MRRVTRRTWLISAATVAVFSSGLVILFSVLGGEAQRQDFADNLEFLKRGRPVIALCVSDLRTRGANETDALSRVDEAIAANRNSLWKGSFLEEERIDVDSPCASTPTVDSATDFLEYITDIRVVDQPGPHILNVFVVDSGFLETLSKLNLGRVIPHEYIDGAPGRPGGFQQVSSAFYVTAVELEDRDFVARNVAEALGCTEECAPAQE